MYTAMHFSFSNIQRMFIFGIFYTGFRFLGHPVDVDTVRLCCTYLFDIVLSLLILLGGGSQILSFPVKIYLHLSLLTLQSCHCSLQGSNLKV